MRNLSCLLLLALIIAPIRTALFRLTVSPSPLTINTPSTHTWSIQYTSPAVARSQFVLHFPTCVSVTAADGVTVTNSSGALMTGLVFGSGGLSSVGFTLPAPVTATTYVFNVNNVRNCFYAGTFRNFNVSNNVDGLEGLSTMASVTYMEGSITGCSLNFNGFTGDIASTLRVPFKVQNPVAPPYLSLRLAYPIYFSSTSTLTTYNSPLSTPNFTLSCSLFLNNTLLNPSPTTASINTNDKTITCVFSSLGYVGNSSDNLVLQLYNISNPITTTRYASNTDFQLNSLDAQGNSYDRSTSCTANTVAIAQFEAGFSGTDQINTYFSPVEIISNSDISLRIARFDQILISYTTGAFRNCLGTMVGIRNANTFFLSQQTTNTPNALLFRASSANNQNGSLSLQLPGCEFQMPPSTLPVTFTWLVSGTDSVGTVSSYDTIMQINAVLQPMYAEMQSSQVALIRSVLTIGDASSYKFSITTGQPLTQTPSLVIAFPSQLDILAINSTLSSCEVAVAGLGVGSRSCTYLPPNSISITLTHIGPVPGSTPIEVTIHNIVNPPDPTPIAGFNIMTIYTASVPAGLVEVGTNVIPPISYQARTVYPVVLGAGFRVYTSGTQVQIQYTVGVALRAGSVTVLTFLGGAVQAVQFVGATGGASLVSNTTTVYNFSLPALPAQSKLVLTFNCLTPTFTGTFSMASLATYYSGLTYEQTVAPITLLVSQPYANVFTVYPNPLFASTGTTTDYSIVWKTVVPHPANFVLEVVLPSGTDLLNGQARCVQGCVSQVFVDTSSGSMDRVQLTIAGPSAACDLGYTCYEVRISKITNQRSVGSTPDFIFTTLVANSSQQILSGTAQASITSPNSLSAQFVQADDYYLNNTNPVRIQVTLTNRLILGDYAVISFPTNTYTINSAVSCAEGACSTSSEPGFLKLRIDFSASQVIFSTVTVEIYGLISDGFTTYGQSIPIQITTYTSSGRPIDTGTVLYSLDCGATPAIITRACKTCTSTSPQTCTSCYSPLSLFNSSTCTNACGNLSQYQTFSNSGVCVPCITPCFTCLSATNCTRCIAGFYLFQSIAQCNSICNTSIGLYVLNVSGFLFCKQCTQARCVSCPGDVCGACQAGYVLLGGACVGGCQPGQYNAGGVCAQCDISCQTCTGAGPTNCLVCAAGYFSIGGRCTSSCPVGRVPIAGGCGCAGDCSTCEVTATSCLSCVDASLFVHRYQCITSCPISTYPVGKQCYACSAGCLVCSSTTCMQCTDNYSIFENKCYSNCKQVSPRFTSMSVNGTLLCVQCPQGCAQCDADYKCTACLEGYVARSDTCVRACELTNTCDVEEKQAALVPVPGLISLGLWAGVVTVLKLTVAKDMQVGYAMLMGGALVYTMETIGLAVVSQEQVKQSAARLLQSSSAGSGLATGSTLLIVALALNYVSNLVFVGLFCRYLRPLIFQRQLDLISNYATLALATLTNYRFYLLPFSRLFKHPYIQVPAPQFLRPLHIILCISGVLDIVPLVGCILILLNSEPLSAAFMLAIDIVVIVPITLVMCLWSVLRSKPDQYFSQTKKYRMSENYVTEEGSIHNNNHVSNDHDVSKAKLNLTTDEKLQIEDLSAEDGNDNLPTLPPNVVKVMPRDVDKPEEWESVNAKTKRKTMTNKGKEKGRFFAGDQEKKQQDTEQFEAENVHRSPYRTQSNFHGAENDKKIKRERNQSSSNIGAQNHQGLRASHAPRQTQQPQLGDKEDNLGGSYKKPMKVKPTTESLHSMKKKPRQFDVMESEPAESNIDEVDFESIVQTRMIDRSKSKQPRSNAEPAPVEHCEQISPSWYNIPNQRYDIDNASIQ